MGLVQNMVVLSPRELCAEFVDGPSFRSVRPCDRIEEKVVCPMPRRPPSVHFSSGEPVKPFLLRRSMPPPSTLDCEASLELLEILRSKNSSVNSTNFGCSPPSFPGTPPSRTGNPIVHDVEFIQRSRISSQHAAMISANVVKVVECSSRNQELLSQNLPPAKPSVAPSIYRSSPRVRVEGFDCPSHGFDHTSRDTRRHVAAIA